jgi:hypothetical protein
MEHQMKKCKFVYDEEKQCFFVENHKADIQKMYPTVAKTLFKMLPAMLETMVAEQQEADQIFEKGKEMKAMNMDVSRQEKMLEDKIISTKIINTSKDGKFSLRLYVNLFERKTYVWLKLYAQNEETGLMEPKSGGMMFEPDDDIPALKTYVYAALPKQQKKRKLSIF